MAAQARESLEGPSPSFAVLFASAHFLVSAEALVAAVAEETGSLPLIGYVAEAVVGGAREVESEPAVWLWLAAGLGLVETFAMEFVKTPSGGAYGGYRFERAAAGVHLMICDPFTFPAGGLLAHLNEHVPGTVIMGGMASGGPPLRQNRLFLDGRVLSHGAVGAHLTRAEVHPLVSQGCRPVGNPYTVTRAEGNVIHELGGRPPLARLQELVTALPGGDRELLAQGVQVGEVINEYRAEPGPGDFLIRSVVGADPGSAAVAWAMRCRWARSCSSTSGTPLGGPGPPAHSAAGVHRARRPPGGRGAAVHVQRPRIAAVFRARPRRRASGRNAGRDPGGGLLLRRRARTGGRAELPARLHGVDRAVPGGDTRGTTAVTRRACHRGNSGLRWAYRYKRVRGRAWSEGDGK